MSVTAVPLQPLPRGTMLKLWLGILFLVLLGVGLAWLGTSALQYSETGSGVRYRIYGAGKGDPVTPADIAVVRIETRVNGEVQSTPQDGQPAQLTADAVPPWLSELFLQMREGGAYQLFVPATVLLEGRPPPPGDEIKADDVIEFRILVSDIQRDGAAQLRMQQQMMQQMQQGGPGGPGGQMPPGAGPGGPPPAGPGGR